MEIRELSSDDGSALHALFAAVLPDSPTARSTDAATRQAFLDDPATFALGAYADDAPVGLAWGIQMRSPSGRLTTYLHELDVRADHRRQGTGTALVEAAMELGRARGSTRFWLSTGGHNDIAQSLYESLGGDRKPKGDVNYWWELDRDA
ncbi:ribosomal protein S18 acetylase RimI-like enzyme [Ilumatobacter fluminis]|uniref:Ribosomal protein S18 acetylase RimI-like enzyme n=1 Tax=Ilumatobacter fluminis TaxID=467091 RepID=A0A4R7HXX1_9ACTN|nr:GNAT family N-acetyltransferase [Ilumatobacter fluminis]TDT16057.1 ribosomal protein S18 acetylase RimI-like enzyme [Ilumatobacter fluminis]